jgi:hypothetical protein
MTTNIDEKIVFALSPSDVGPILTLGIPTAAWEYMKDGKTHTFDLTSLGVPIKFVLFGAASHQAAIQVLKDSAEKNDVPFLDRRHKDWSIK